MKILVCTDGSKPAEKAVRIAATVYEVDVFSTKWLTYQ